MNEENKDPLYPDTNVNNEGDVPPTPPAPSKEAVQPETVTSIAEELSNEAKGDTTDDGVVNAKSNPIDISQLTDAQVQELKARFDVTPDKRLNKVVKAKARLRSIEGQIVEDFKTAVNVLVDDPENQRKVYRHIIPVKFFGAEEYKNVPYDEFINAEQVEFEIIRERREAQEKVIGTVFSRERGREVEAVEVKTFKWFTVKIDGKEVELPSKMKNA